MLRYGTTKVVFNGVMLLSIMVRLDVVVHLGEELDENFNSYTVRLKEQNGLHPDGFPHDFNSLLHD